MRLFTIGFTKTTAESFFDRLAEAGVKKLIDVRLNNSSQLAGFAKRDDLAWFLRVICGIEYEHRPDLAPTKDLLRDYRAGDTNWSDYEEQFLALLASRQLNERAERDDFDGSCLLCSEDEAVHCHRRLVAERLHDVWEDLEIIHL